MENQNSVVFGRWEWKEELGASLFHIAQSASNKAKDDSGGLTRVANKLEACGLVHCFVTVFSVYPMPLYAITMMN